MPMNTAQIDQIIDAAKTAAMLAAQAQFEADGSRDRGSCGGAMLGYRGNTKFAKMMVERGVAYSGDGATFVMKQHGLPTQNADVDIAYARAFMQVADNAGIRASKYWTYTD